MLEIVGIGALIVGAVASIATLFHLWYSEEFRASVKQFVGFDPPSPKRQHALSWAMLLSLGSALFLFDAVHGATFGHGLSRDVGCWLVEDVGYCGHANAETGNDGETGLETDAPSDKPSGSGSKKPGSKQRQDPSPQPTKSPINILPPRYRDDEPKGSEDAEGHSTGMPATY